MSGNLMAMLVLCVAAASAAAAPSKKNPGIEREVKSELVGKTFNTKILVGSYIQCPNAPRNDALKMVDTELTPQHQIRFFARANCFFPGGSIIDSTRGYVNAQFLGEIPPGSAVWVRGVDFKDDRVEVRLSMNNNDLAGGSGKIKFMVGPDYRSWSKDELMQAIAMGIRIPAYEKLVELKKEFEELRAALPESENKYNSSGAAPDLKLANAIALRQILERLQKNRAEFATMGNSDPQAGVYTEKLTALVPEIARLTEVERKQRVAHVRDQLQAQLQDLSKIQNLARQKPPSSLADWQQRSDLLATYATLLDNRQRLHDSLRNEDEAPSPEDAKYMSESRAEVEADQKALELGHQQIELADLTSEYRQLTKERSQKLDAYSRAFATNKEKPALHGLVVVLVRIVANRDRAAGLGDKTAATQLKQCQAEAEKYKRKLSPNDPLAASGGQGISAANSEGEALKKVTIPAGEMLGRLLQKADPIYPPVAKAARVSGTVVLQATISKTGSVEDLRVVSGPPLLQGAALDAVKTWIYRPYLLEGKPVEVETTINVIFILGN